MVSPDIGTDAIDRIVSKIDIRKHGIKEIRAKLAERFDDWTEKQIEGFAQAIRADQKRPKVRLPEQALYTVKAPRRKTGFQRTVSTVRDHAGKFMGKKENIKVTTRSGDKLYIKNIKTGKKSWIQL